ncbi:hypothetical protein LF599_02605 [Pseudodesulfovibrio thermohalotolerans]|uniref:hypothetical protein n=1 Tax=Pseudodesulfovibrio thermohalotolerans TaxID=2880651 RepID=UPI002441B2C7|nr:hypothetical protein [Pseudodesulfovibrio thermohalotolerans]WFS63068.1 hypothetical protein LF599_02605 [Pseudodesulfovibrio thermohalotolerans]
MSKRIKFNDGMSSVQPSAVRLEEGVKGSQPSVAPGSDGFGMNGQQPSVAPVSSSAPQNGGNSVDNGTGSDSKK